jgi:hypothetical protein
MAKRSVKIGGAVVGAALAAGVAFWAGSSMVDSPEETAADKATTTASGPSTTTPGNLVEFRDDKTGWALSYPKSWIRLGSSDAAVPLIVSQKAPELNQGGSILARTLVLAAPVTDANLAMAKGVTDTIVTAGVGVELLTEQPTVIHQGGLPGYFYFYRFKDPTTGQNGVHTHYFLFKGSTMISFVFQALPEGEFQALAGLYDEVISSFRVL